MRKSTGGQPGIAVHHEKENRTRFCWHALYYVWVIRLYSQPIYDLGLSECQTEARCNTKRMVLMLGMAKEGIGVMKSARSVV